MARTWGANILAQTAPIEPLAPTMATLQCAASCSIKAAARSKPSTAVNTVYELPEVTPITPSNRLATEIPASPATEVNAPNPITLAPSSALKCPAATRCL